MEAPGEPRSLDAQTWQSMRNCVNEALEETDGDAFRARSGFGRDEALSLLAFLREHRDVRPALSASHAQLAAACCDVACELVDDWEFSTRVGFDKADALRLATLLRASVSI